MLTDANLKEDANLMLKNDANMMLTDAFPKEMLKHDAKEMLVDAKLQTDAKVMLITDVKHVEENKLTSLSKKKHTKQKGSGAYKDHEECKTINNKQDIEEEKHSNKV